MGNKEIKYNLWAKKQEDHGKFLWLPLIQHLEDTKNITGLLWEHWLGEGQKKLIENSLKSDFQTDHLGKKIAQFLAATHDLGKATPAFQTQKGYANSEDLDIILLENLEQSGFEGISNVLLASPRKSHHSIAGQYLLYTYGVREDIATIIGGHHGKPIDDDLEYENQKSYQNNYFQSEDSNSTIYQKWNQVQRDIFGWALESSGFKSVEALPKIKQPAQVILSGLLIMSDWIASNERYFPLVGIDDSVDFNQTDRTKYGFTEWKKTSLWEPEDIVDIDHIYKKRFDFGPRNVQSVLSESIVNSKKPGIYILEAPMGIGKTEAALVAAEKLAAKTGRNGIFFGLPTQATSNGIFTRIEKWVESIKNDSRENVSIHLVHGKAALNEEFASLPKGNDINMDDPENGSVIVNEWFSGRKTSSLDDFVVGTVDQFLMVALKQKHLALRHLGFSKKVVVIDEVHAYDAYMSQYLLEAIKWMGAYGVPVVILSATLPAEKREELLKSYMRGAGKKWDKNESKKLSQDLKTNAYPLITYSDASEVHQIKTFEDSISKEISIIRLEENQLSKTVEKSIMNGGVIGIIVNTVKRAQELARYFSEKFGEGVVEVLHSSFIATERIRKEKELLTMIGKEAQRPARKIIIGTQVIEQSLDIDFDVLISDLAPMDLLIQRIGRLHRHEINRPQQHKNPKFYVLGVNDNLEFEEGSSFVYGDFLLARTQYYLPDSINLPEDISILVQKVYDINLDIAYPDEKLDEKYQVAKREYKNIIDGKKRKAKNYRIEDPVLKESRSHKENLIGWLKNPNPDDSEEKAYAQVRDIEDTIEVIALKETGEGYRLFGEARDISKFITDFNTAKSVAKNTLRLPMVLSKSYNIDKSIEELEKYNKANLNTWRDSPWLKGSLGIIFDQNNEYVVNGYKIRYNERYGVEIERVEKSE
ncbi:CRISPR-associated helicase Cas3' [Streptococcus mutans]|nr:CRISPR-associated helicase Cas3' [Streptococcus mutans]MCB5085596.1 CRISPR-associated helicase Cas3' [Streptococcus mutans]MCB5086427.1 CRISPR-associated helicase Cas3' [Streptococcus mutans]